MSGMWLWMPVKKIVPCLDCDLCVPGGRVVKGVKFKQITYAGVPWELAEKYSKGGADELVMLDITASRDRRETMANVVKHTAEHVSVPFAVGGGMGSAEDAGRILKAGADKVSINTAAVKTPDLINRLSEAFGSQACVVAVDARRNYDVENGPDNGVVVKTGEGKCWFECSIYGGHEFTGMDAIQWSREAARRGAGEILPTSMDRDGTKDGYDIPMIKAVCEAVNIPVTASGGCGEPAHILEVFLETDASAALAASIFHYDEYGISEVKEYLRKHGVDVRI